MVDLLNLRGTLLSRYVRIANEILMHLRSTRRTRAEVSLYDPIGVDKEGNEFQSAVYLFIKKYWIYYYQEVI